MNGVTLDRETVLETLSSVVDKSFVVRLTFSNTYHGILAVARVTEILRQFGLSTDPHDYVSSVLRAVTNASWGHDSERSFSISFHTDMQRNNLVFSLLADACWKDLENIVAMN